MLMIEGSGKDARITARVRASPTTTERNLPATGSTLGRRVGCSKLNSLSVTFGGPRFSLSDLGRVTQAAAGRLVSRRPGEVPVVNSLRLIFGRAIISLQGLDESACSSMDV